MRRIAVLILITVFLSLSQFVNAVEDPYAAWGHGRPQDAITPLHEQAEQSKRWDAWLDLGLAAAAAKRHGDAVAWIVQAHQLAPHRDEPRQALQALSVTIPPGWLDRLGPLALPGTGWLGIILLSGGALALGYGLFGTKHRKWTLIISAGLFVTALPGRLACDHDQTRGLTCAVKDTLLYDSTGTPVREVPAGTVLQQDQSTVWAERILITLPDGQRGFIPVVDTIATP